MHTTLFARVARACSVTSLILVSAAASLHADYITGVTATTTMGSGFGANIQNTVNGAGLSTRSLTATHAGTSPTNSWVSSGTLTGTVTFSLPQTLLVTGFSFWNQNNGGPGATGSTGIRDVAITYSSDGTTFVSLPDAPTTLNRVVGATGPPQIVSFPAVMASHIRVQVLNNHGDASQTGFAEIAFDRNQSPTISAADTITTDEETPTNFSIITADPDGDPDVPPTVTFSTPASGMITGAAGNYTYTPNLNANGADNFTITVNDRNGGTVTKTVSVIINPINDAPIFGDVPEMLTTDEDTAANIVVSATDAEGDPVTLSFSDAVQGEVSATAGSYAYTPNSNANGAGSFTIIATDGNGGRTTKVVSVTINPVNDAPIFANVPQTLTTDEDTAANFVVSTSDADGDLVTLGFSDVAHGVVSGSEGNYVYVPNPNANGTGSFTITASDGNGGMTSATVTLTILAVNDAPVFTTIPSALTTDEDTATNFMVVTSDADGDPVAVSVSGAAKGAVSGSAGNYTYTPNAGATGGDTFTVTATDGQGATTTASVQVTIVGYPASYALLLGDASGVHAVLTLRLSGRGFLTGYVRDENNQRVQVQRALLPPDGSSVTLSLKDGSSLALQFDTKRRVNATLTMSGRELSGAGNVAVVPPAGVPGRYTMVLDTGSGGFGWCVLVVTKRGGVRILGKLPDGSAMIANQGMPIDRENDASLFLLGKGAAKALLSGSLHFAAQTQSDVTGSLNFRQGGTDTACEASGAHFSAAKSALPAGSYPLVFEGAGVSQAATVTLGSDNSATVLKPVVSFTPGGGTGHLATGVFNVKFRVAGPGGTPPGPLLSGSGIFIQTLGKGFGQFINDGATGQVLIGE